MKLQLILKVFITALFLFQVLFSPTAQAQFNGKFAIQRHFLDLENFLDWKSYQGPISWRYEWYRTRNGMRVSVGSISMYRFYMYHEIRLEADIGEYFTVLYEQKEDSLYEPDPIQQLAEFRFGKDWYASIIGFPTHEKKQGHMGYAVSHGKRQDLNYIHISFLEQFGLYNEKNANTDKNDRDEEYITIPVLERIQVRKLWLNRFFFDLDYQRVNPTEFYTENPQQSQFYESVEYTATLDWKEDQWILGISAYSDRQLRSHKPVSPSTSIPDLEQELLLKWTDLYYAWRFNANNTLTVGMLDAVFENQIDSTFPEHIYENRFITTQAYSLWEHSRSDWFQWIFSLQLGPAFLKKDYLSIDETVDDGRLESKAGVGVVMMEKEKYRFYINTTWDLDLFTTRQWDGGNVQVQFYF